MPEVLDASSVRTWCALALEALGRTRTQIDAINVFPVADGDTGTNLYLTVESAAQAVEAVWAAYGEREPAFGDVMHAMAHGALLGARGNSGTILAQLLRGMAAGCADGIPADGRWLGEALRRAAPAAREAVAHPVEGTMLSVAAGAAGAAGPAGPDSDPDPAPAAVARAAHAGAREALAATPGQLAALAEAGVVDAGGSGLVTVLGALADALDGGGSALRLIPVAAPAASAVTSTAASAARAASDGDPHTAHGGPAYEVVYLLDADATAVRRLRERLDALGDSLVVSGGDGLWRVHVHVDDPGAALEAGTEAGRPHRIQVTHFCGGSPKAEAPREGRAVVLVVPGQGLARLCTEAGATTVLAATGEPPASGEIAAALAATGAREVVLLPNDTALRHAAAIAVEQARTAGVRVALIPTRAAVQGLAALAVHEPQRRFDEDVVAMTAAAGATRYAELLLAEERSWTSAGICERGDVLGLIEGDVAVIGAELAGTAADVLDRMLASGGELVTLVLGPAAPAGLGEALRKHVRQHHLAVDTVVYEGGQQPAPLLIGVE
ncbi:DAK2 domain-containing protein [Streptomyces polyrhachis]|uniref:DAK2 domain-containing protein n=1 Tax=Streptomyces polyrhachis TaxID=1282885 RepID=A0ABW2GE90_9ACTN